MENQASNLSIWTVALIPCVLLVSYVITFLYRKFALNMLIMDMPGERRSHSVSTPRGGGIAIVMAYTGSLSILLVSGMVPAPLGIALIGSGMGVALIGFVDDIRHVSVGARLLAHFLASWWALYWLGGLPSLELFHYHVDLGLLGLLFGSLFIVWMINLYNFMDGIDGIASVEAISVSLGAIILCLVMGVSTQIVLVLTLLICAVAGFMVWNFPKAKIFLGDVGSGYLGVIFALLTLNAGWMWPDLFWSLLILLGVFIVDATLTLIRRFKHGQRIFEPHRSHAYQVASRRYGSHAVVSLSIGAINLFWLLPIAMLVMLDWIDGLMGVAIGYIPLVWLAVRLDAGLDQS